MFEVGKKYINEISNNTWTCIAVDTETGQAWMKSGKDGTHLTTCEPCRSAAWTEVRDPITITGWANVYGNDMAFYGSDKKVAYRLCRPDGRTVYGTFTEGTPPEGSSD